LIEVCQQSKRPDLTLIPSSLGRFGQLLTLMWAQQPNHRPSIRVAQAHFRQLVPPYTDHVVPQPPPTSDGGPPDADATPPVASAFMSVAPGNASPDGFGQSAFMSNGISEMQNAEDMTPLEGAFFSRAPG